MCCTVTIISSNTTVSHRSKDIEKEVEEKENRIKKKALKGGSDAVSD
jgi:hypothetical protein